MPADFDWAALGEQLGLLAWPLFLGLAAAGVLVSGGVAAWFAHGATQPSAEADTQSRPLASGFAARLGTRLIGSFAVMLATAAVFTAVARLLGDGSRLQHWDEALSRSVATNVPPAAMSAFGWLTHFGEPLALTGLGAAVGVALWLAGRRGLTLAWVAALGGNAVLNPLLKLVFTRARPLHPEGVSPAMGFSFPSGHSSGAMVTYGMLAYLAWRLLTPRWRVPAVMLAAAVIITTASSRVFLQVHFASDVFAGMCSGLGWLALCIGSVEFARHRAGLRGG
jgi:membrane-associated phospholipid phosphatase